MAPPTGTAVQIEPRDVLGDLRARILALDLLPGAPLSRPELRARYGVSSTPVRDALLRLREEGLVDIHPQARTLVSRIDLDAARQAHFLRSAVEQAIVHDLACGGAAPAPGLAPGGAAAEAAEKAAAPAPDLARDLARILDLQKERAAAGDLAGFAALDAAFHRRLFEAAGLAGLHRLVRRQSGHIDRLRALHLPREDKVRDILADHARILAALAAGEPDAARAAMARHLSHSMAHGPQLRAEHPAFFTA